MLYPIAPLYINYLSVQPAIHRIGSHLLFPALHAPPEELSCAYACTPGRDPVSTSQT